MPEKNECDDGLPWGRMIGDFWLELPKIPMLNAGFGPPPFDLMMPDGKVRRIMHEPRKDKPYGGPSLPQGTEGVQPSAQSDDG